MKNPLFDDLPLWSAPFGLTLLNTVRFRKNIRILDIGCGSGFPMIELAERFGETCHVFGIDADSSFRDSIFEKIKSSGIINVDFVHAPAEELPFSNRHFGLIVSNNGLNNVVDERRVLAECFRVSQPDAQMVIAMNLPGTMKEFYQAYEKILAGLNMNDEIRKMNEHISEKRKPAGYWEQLITESGFSITSISIEEFRMRFSDGSSFLKHSLIRNAFRSPWEELLPSEKVSSVFSGIEEELNQIAEREKELSLSIPYVCFDCKSNQVKDF